MPLVLARDQHVAGLEIAVQDALLVRVLHALAHLLEQVDAFSQRQLVPVAVVSDRNPLRPAP